MSEIDRAISPDCLNNKCFGCDNGKCLILTDNNFKGRSCPFFKTPEQLSREEKKRLRRMGGKS